MTLSSPTDLTAVAATAAVVILLFAVFRWCRPRPDRPLAEKLGDLDERPIDADDYRALKWLPPDQDLVDRRRSLRRGGPATPIRVAVGIGPRPSGGTAEGLVVDRSTGGLCFAAHGPFAVDTEVLVRADGAPPGSPWVAATVRFCRRRGDCYLVGCAFHQTPSWDVLLLFG